MSRVGEKIQNLRNSKGISRKQLAKKIGVAEKFLGEVETGRKIINESLINKISKVLGQDINDISMNFDEEAMNEQVKESAYKAPKVTQGGVSDSWGDALSSVLKDIPIHGYDLNKVIGNKKMPVISNKIEGHAKDKVLFIKIEDNNMRGFRIAEGDLAFAYLTNEIRNKSICLVEVNSKRAIRQINKLDNEKILLISNLNGVKTETINKKSLKILAKIEWVKFEV